MSTEPTFLVSSISTLLDVPSTVCFLLPSSAADRCRCCLYYLDKHVIATAFGDIMNVVFVRFSFSPRYTIEVGQHSIRMANVQCYEQE